MPTTGLPNGVCHGVYGDTRDGTYIRDGWPRSEEPASKLAADRFAFEKLTIPTLVMSARDDDLAPYRFAGEAGAPHLRRRSW
jgi:hypothetical protein